MLKIGSSTNFRGVRKGSWTDEEDELLRKCIGKYGEGNWHRVPQRSGLNRCRKSCRLRWMNYLKPNIKRGQFNNDEVDLILRMHKLLGNRWSLIAGRLPGRTANDVKNYWNTHLHKKLIISSISRPPRHPTTLNNNICNTHHHHHDGNKKQQPTSLSTTTSITTTTTSTRTSILATMPQIIRPQPRTFPKPASRVRKPGPLPENLSSDISFDDKVLCQQPLEEDDEEEINGAKWWESFLVGLSEENEKEYNGPVNGPGYYHDEPGTTSHGESLEDTLWPTALKEVSPSLISSVGGQYPLWEDDCDQFWNFHDTVQ